LDSGKLKCLEAASGWSLGYGDLTAGIHGDLRMVTDKVKFTGLTQTLGQLQQPLIGILSQTAGSTDKFWVNPVNFRLKGIS
jgi:hypothetical protein